MFAGEAKFIKCLESFNYQLLLQDVLATMESWCSDWKLKLNIDKYILEKYRHLDSKCFVDVAIH